MILNKELENTNRSILQLNNKMEQMNQEYGQKLQIIEVQCLSKIENVNAGLHQKIKTNDNNINGN